MGIRAPLVRYMAALAVRNRLTGLLFLFAVVLSGTALILTWLTPGTERRTFYDLAYLGLEFLAVATPILASTAIHVLEFDQRTVWLVLVRPVTRPGYTWGRFWGVTGAAWVNLSLASLLVGALALLLRALPEPWFVGVVVAAFLESLVIGALSCLVAFVTTSFVTALVVNGGIVLLGYLTPTLHAAVARSGNAALRLAGDTVYWVLPHLADFSVREFTRPAEGWYLTLLAIYALAWTGAALAAATAVFLKREV